MVSIGKCVNRAVCYTVDSRYYQTAAAGIPEKYHYIQYMLIVLIERRKRSTTCTSHLIYVRYFCLSDDDISF